MEINEAILAFSQSDKIKSSLIWSSQAVEMFVSLSEDEKPGARKIIRAVISMIGHEINLCKKSAPHALWAEVQQSVDTAMVMIDSNVTQESVYHLTQALSKVTSIGQQSLTCLKENALI
jgi:hypothetical protein